MITHKITYVETAASKQTKLAALRSIESWYSRRHLTHNMTLPVDTLPETACILLQVGDYNDDAHNVMKLVSVV